MIPVLQPEQRWECPNCDLEQVTHEARPHSRMHPCKGLHGLTTPMVPAGTKAKVVAVERGDYIGQEAVQLDPERGRPVMSVHVTRDEGEDAVMYAPCATATREEVLDAIRTHGR